MRAQVELVIEWEKSTGNDGREIKEISDLEKWVFSTINSKALVERLEIEAVNSGSKELDDE
jgi:hypothetical protein